MSAMSFNYNQKDKKTIFTTATETMATTTTESYNSSSEGPGRNGNGPIEGLFSPLAPAFHSQRGNDLIELLTQHEPKVGDTAPPTVELDEEMLMNLRINGTENLMFTDIEQQSNNNGFYMGGGRQESDTSSNIWGDGSSMSGNGRNGESIDTFDFLVKSLSSANNYVSMLTREQLSVLRAIRPSVLYEFLLEVAKVRTDKRMRRALPNECAFCKNNGENEECYSSHALKDWRGRVLCPVLRAFRCPRCGATGDRAHTIKYCPENEAGAGLERSNSFGGRRRSSAASSLLLGGAPLLSNSPSAPSTPGAGTASMPHSSVWNNFGIN